MREITRFCHPECCQLFWPCPPPVQMSPHLRCAGILRGLTQPRSNSSAPLFSQNNRTLSLQHTFTLGIFWMQLPFATNKIRCNYRCTVSCATLHSGWYVCGWVEFQTWALFIALTHTCYFWRWCGSWAEKSGAAWSHSFRGPSAFWGAGSSGCTFDLLLNSLHRTTQPKQGPPVADLNAVCSLTSRVHCVPVDLKEVERLAWRELLNNFQKEPA